MKRTFQGDVALVTGAASGIGTTLLVPDDGYTARYAWRGEYP
ncbi:hypothetical protein [Pseudomonas aeruginosa]|nr:hypothetical protein [Pseudomonas aeruginosa]